MDQVLSPPLVPPDGWKPKLKHYPHFDAVIHRKNIEELVREPGRVAANKFYPFMLYTQRWQPFRGRKGGKPDKKERPIRFASRRDAYILSYYRYILSQYYEDLLRDLGLTGCVLAYRRIKQLSGAGKSNIDFAKEAFEEIRKRGDCAAVALDISSFFESLDHLNLRAQWARLLKVDDLPPDHQAVFRAVTRYAVVERDEVYLRLGFLKKEVVNGKERLTYTIPFKSMPKKLCSNADFQEKICGKGGLHKSLVNVNRKPFGIPQGSPISDLLANIYLLDFDRVTNAWCVDRGGVYFRYSDDILIIIPGSDAQATEACEFAKAEITKHGSKLLIKDKKTSVVVYEQGPSGRKFRHIAGQQGRNGLEYLGFRYDGKEVWIRDSTISKLYRKVAGAIKVECGALVKRYPGKDEAFVLSKFNYSRFFQRYGRVEEFDTNGDYETWTFWTYARRAFSLFGKVGRPIPLQLRRYKLIVKRRVEREISRRLS